MDSLKEFFCKCFGHKHTEIKRNYGMVKDDVTYRCNRCGNQYTVYNSD